MDGKVYPPAVQGGPSGSVTPPAACQMPNPLQQMAQQVDNRSQQSSSISRQRQSPTVTPPLSRPLLPQGGPNSGYNNSSGLFSNSPQFPPSLRNFPGDNPSRFPMPHTMGPPQPHVSSSTHPNMGNGKRFGSCQNDVKLNSKFLLQTIFVDF